MKSLFNLAYGSNLHRARIEARIEIISVVGAVELPGWGLRFHKQGGDRSGKCNLIRAHSETAYAVVYEISAADKTRLDAIEGPGYRDHTLALDDVGEVSVYLAHASHIDDSLQPFDWYHRFVRDGAGQCGFPTHYLEQIDAVTTTRDPDHERRISNYELLSTRL